MKSFMDSLNLRPNERRLVVVVAVVVFIVLNLWLVRPHFKDWAKAKTALEKARTTLEVFKKESDPARLADFQARLKDLEGQGSTVLPAEQSLDLIRAIQTQAAQGGVNITANTEVNTSGVRTNEFFEEKARLISVITGEKELVDFLVSLASSNSMIRVRSMNLRPDGTQTKLQGSITLVASYQRSRPKPVAPVAAAKIPGSNIAPPRNLPGAGPPPAPPKASGPSITPRKTEPAKTREIPSPVNPPKKPEPPKKT